MAAEKDNIEITAWEDIDFSLDKYWRVEITPTIAQKILKERNYSQNRPMKRKNETYARDMRNGSWVSGTGETLKFGSDGVLYDGQNRISGVIKADTPVVFDIKTGIPDGAYDVLDSGVSRTDGDALAGKVPNAQKAATISRTAQCLMNGSTNLGSHVGINVAPSRQEIVSFAIENNDAIQELIKIGRKMGDSVNVGGVGLAGWFVAYWLTYEKDKEAADEFLESFINDTNNAKRIKRDMLRQADAGGKLSKEWAAYMYIEEFTSTMLGRETTYECTTNDEVMKAYKKLFCEYLEHMRTCGTVFDFE